MGSAGPCKIADNVYESAARLAEVCLARGIAAQLPELLRRHALADQVERGFQTPAVPQPPPASPGAALRRLGTPALAAAAAARFAAQAGSPAASGAR
jgi:hypothetical protein